MQGYNLLLRGNIITQPAKTQKKEKQGHANATLSCPTFEKYLTKIARVVCLLETPHIMSTITVDKDGNHIKIFKRRNRKKT